MSSQTVSLDAPNGEAIDLDANKALLLIVEEKDIQLIIGYHLSKLGFRHVIPLRNAYEAIKFRKNFDEEISLTISGYEMTHMTGLEYINEVREDDTLDSGPFSMILEDPSEAKIALAAEHNVDSILVKPFTLDRIPIAIQKAFNNFHGVGCLEKEYTKAKSFLRAGSLEEAKEIYSKINDQAQGSARALVGLAKVAQKEANLEEALKHLDAAEGLNSKYVHIYTTRAVAYLENNDEDSGIKALRQAINVSPLNPLRYDQVAELLSAQQRFAEIIELLNVAYAYELDFPNMHHYLSQAYLHEKDYEEATRHIRLALYKDKENVMYLNQLGICHKAQNFYNDAISTYNQVIKIDPDNKSALYNKAIVLNLMDDIEGATKLLERILAKDPSFTLAKKKLDELKSQKISA